ncbi:MAG: AAA family ATPase, partial [Chlamydiae bacterium]|nr:AAA family ATPase [Chlamydiota bacterium]
VEQKQLKMPVQLMGSRAFGSVVAVIGNIIGAVGLADLFKTSEDDMQASFKAQKILMLVSLINILIQILIPVLGAKTAGMAIGSAVGGLTLVSLVWPKIKPIPERLPGNAINLTEEVLQGKIEPSDSRPVVTEGLHRTLKSGKHALLIGPSRMGKTQALKAFAEKVTRGEYPQFKGKKVWYWNTADLAEHQSSMIMGGTNNPLRNIRENVGRNMDNIIFCFDEIHSAMTKEDSALPEQMKTAFDEGGPFKHVIGITTDEEYQQYVAPNRALANRFSHVRVETMDKESTIRVLSDMILRHPNMPILDEGILEYIYTKTTTDETIPQPFTACGVLSRCLEQLEGSVITTLAQEISQIEGRISAQHAIAITTTSVPQTKELKQQLVEKKQEMEQKVEQVTKLKRAKQLLFAVRKGKYEAALKEQKRTYTVLSKVEAQLKAQIEALSTELEIPAKITKEMVDGIINPTLESDV